MNSAAETQAGFKMANRAIARTTLLQLAREAEAAINVERKHRLRVVQAEESEDICATALRTLRNASEKADTPDLRGKFSAHAADVIEFCAFVGQPLADAPQARSLYASARTLVGSMPSSAGTTDLTADVQIRLRQGRSLRIDRQYDAADQVLTCPDEYFMTSGVPHLHWAFKAESVANLVARGQASQADAESESDGFASEGAASWPTRHRYEQMDALAQLAQGKFEDGAARLGSVVNTWLTATSAIDYVDQICLLLNHADALTAPETDEERSAAASASLRHALRLLSTLRARWRVVARSRTPLATAFQSIYGEVALIATRIGGKSGAAIGFEAACLAKQTGFAELLRSGRSLLHPKTRAVIDTIVKQEERLSSEPAAFLEEAIEQQIENQLRNAIAPFLAALVAPEQAEIATIVSTLDGRTALDFVRLSDASGDDHWFRSVVGRNGPEIFERFELSSAVQRAFAPSDEASRYRLHGVGPAEAIWRILGKRLLPEDLRNLLASTSTDAPVELVISPHDFLGAIPWAALHVDDRGRALVDAAVVTQTPSLTLLESGQVTSLGDGNALVCFGAGLKNTRRERVAWELGDPDSTAGLLALAAPLTSAARPIGGRLAAALEMEADRYEFLHLAAHGTGTGLSQQVRIDSGPLFAGHAFALQWPRVVLLAVCHVGQTQNYSSTEPFGFSMALFSGGSRAVIGGLLEVSDQGTGRLSADLVGRLRAGQAADRALRDIQRSMWAAGDDVISWALMAAVVR